MLVAILVDTRKRRREILGSSLVFMGVPSVPHSVNAAIVPATEWSGLPAKVKRRATRHHAAAFAVPLKNASRSVLIVSASVVGMP